jgi:sugar O-acyltransferase (sialic acid O-acetyltransferase NeuD family)
MKVFIIGGGGHASILKKIYESVGNKIYGVVVNKKKINRDFTKLKVISDEQFIRTYKPDEVLLINGVGSLPGNKIRFELFKKYKKLGFSFEKVISKNAFIEDNVILKEGAQVMPGAIINNFSKIGENTIINSGVLIEHDCNIGKNNHIAPRSTILGGVKTKENVHISPHALILQNLSIGKNSCVSSNTVLKYNLKENELFFK